VSSGELEMRDEAGANKGSPQRIPTGPRDSRRRSKYPRRLRTTARTHIAMMVFRIRVAALKSPHHQV
jgi:hypothetical protein